jgi:O-antigen/teichoic acid export membrane protein
VYPALVEISFKENKEKLKQVHARLLLITVCFVVIAFWMVLILNYWFLKLWVGEEFFAGVTTLLLTLVLMIRHNIIHVSSLFLFGGGIVKGISFVAIIEAAINITLTIILGKAFGVNGIILASILAGIVTTSWYIPYKLSKYLQMNFKEYFLKPILLPFIIINLFGILMYWVMYQLFQIISVNWWTFLFLAFFLCIAFCVFIWVSFLRKVVGNYVPNKLRKYLLIP